MLCAFDNQTGVHSNYGIGYTTDDIDYKKLKAQVLEVLNNEMNPAASSKMGKTKGKKKKKRKNKKRK